MKEYTKYLERTENELYLDGCSLTEIAKKYGTPLYVISESTLDDTLAEIQENFINAYDNVLPLYASKALSTKFLYKKVKQYGFGVDVVSAGEIFVALQGGTDPNCIYFHGSNKGEDEIKYAIEHGVIHFIIDNFHEIALLERIATELETKVKGMLRIVPQVKAGGHKYIQTGAIDTKFGFSTHDLTYHEAIRAVLATEQIEFIGLHCHTGSQIMKKEPFLDTAKAMFEYAKSIYETFNIAIPELNIGGGYGIVYEEGEKALGFSEVIHDIMDVLNTNFAELGMARPKILIEPGRSIVGNAAMTLYTVGSKKIIPDVREYVEIDGGMADNIRPSLYQAKYNAFLVNDAGRTEQRRVTIAGKCCESGDILIEDIDLPILQANDILAVPSTGAYNYSMSSNYNQLCKPAMVVLHEGEDRLTIRRQTFEDLVACEVED